MQTRRANMELLRKFTSALADDRYFDAMIIEAVKTLGRGVVEGNSPDDVPTWPGYQDALEMMRLDRLLPKEVRKMGPLVRTLYQGVMDQMDIDKMTNAADQAAVISLPERRAKDFFDDAVADALEEIRDREEERRDPWGYRGLSPRDRYGSEQLLRQGLIRLAAEQPHIRKHIIPLLRNR